jgi:hypothetical protein
MPTNLAIDDALIEEAKQAGQHKTKKDAVTAALKEYITHRKQMKIVDLFGTIDYDPDYDYKRERRARPRGRSR